MRSFLLAAAVAGLVIAPARAADLEKYLPEDAAFYVHITTKNFLAAPVVRKAIPMAFDKYGDQLLPFIQLAKQFNPNAPDVPEEKIKEGINELKKPETIAKGFDAAKEFGPDIVVAGSGDAGDPEKFIILVKCAEVVTPEVAEQFIPLINASGQVKVKTSKVGKATVFEMNVPQQNQTIYGSIPEAGVICIGIKKEAVESAVKATAAKIDPELKKQMAKRLDKDFLFAAGSKGKGGEREAFVGSLVLDKDISGKLTATFATAEEAKQKGDELTGHVKQMVETLKAQLGDGARDLKAQLDKMKARVDGKTVTFEGTIPGGVVEKLLAKD